MLRCNQRGRRHDVKIAESPRFLLDVLDLVMLRLALDIANVEVPVVNIPFEHVCHRLFHQPPRSPDVGLRKVSKPHTKRRTIIPANRARPIILFATVPIVTIVS